jgi:hypothetical protein
MQEEFDALLANRTWALVPRLPRANIVRGKWVFKHKYKADGTLEHYKARWVLRSITQCPGNENFSAVVKLATSRTVLSLALLIAGRYISWI